MLMLWKDVALINFLICTGLLFTTTVPLVPRKIRYRKTVQYKYFGMVSTILAACITLTVISVGAYVQHGPSVEVGIGAAIITFILSAISLPLVFTLVYSSFIAFFITLHTPSYQTEKSVFDTLKAKEYPSVDVIIPSRNEPFDVTKMTFDSVLALRYPKRKLSVTVVDNSDPDHPELAAWQEYVEARGRTSGVKVQFIHREGTEGYKPKNLDIGLAHTDGEFVLLLDVDSTVLPNALIMLLPPMYEDAQVGFVQSYAVSTNKGVSPLANISAWGLGLTRYRETIRGAHGGWPLFVGHNAIWRRSVLDEIGACTEYHRGEVVVVEDASMTLRAFSKGYYGTYTWYPTGEWVPGSLEDLESMWSRWAYGTGQVLVKYSRQIFGLARNTATLTERVDVLQHTMGYVALGLTPFWMVLVFVLPHSHFGTFMSLLVLIPWAIHVVAYFANKNLRRQYGNTSKGYEFLTAMFIVEPFLVWVKCRAVVRYLLHSFNGWKPTGKKGGVVYSWGDVLKRRIGILVFSTGILCWFVIDIFTKDIQTIVSQVPAAIMAFGMLSTIVLYGRMSMRLPKDLARDASIATLAAAEPTLELYRTAR